MAVAVAEPVAVLDLGGTQVRSAVVADGRLVGRRDGPADVERGADNLVARCAASVEESIAEHVSAGGRRPALLGVSAPGPLEPARGLLLDPPNLGPSLHDFPLGDRLAQATGLGTFVDRDTQLAALAEGRHGAATGLSDFVYLTVSTGVGGAVVSEGRLLRGRSGLAGELGHLVVAFDGPPCSCGARGHLEAFAAGSGISRRATAALASGRGADVLRELAQRSAPAPVSAASVAAAEDAGDPLAAEIMADARQAFAAALVSIVDVFAPQRVVVGGGVAMGQGERLLGPARVAVATLAFKAQAAQVEIVPAALGDDVGLLGASVLVEERLGV